MNKDIKASLDSVAERLLYGVMSHSEMVQYYSFLSLPHYANEHGHHYQEESETYHKYVRFLIGKYNYVYRQGAISAPAKVPASWNGAEIFNVSDGDRKKYVAYGLKQWLDWEEVTLDVFQEAANTLYMHGELFAFKMISRMIESVESEIDDIKQYITRRSALINSNEVLEEDKYEEPVKKEEQIAPVTPETINVVQ